MKNSSIQQLVIGCVLGDGYLTKSGCLQIEHSIKQKEYVNWKYEQLKEVVVPVGTMQCTR